MKELKNSFLFEKNLQFDVCLRAIPLCISRTPTFDVEN